MPLSPEARVIKALLKAQRSGHSCMAAAGFGGVGAVPAWYHLGTHSGVGGVVCLAWARQEYLEKYKESQHSCQGGKACCIEMETIC